MIEISLIEIAEALEAKLIGSDCQIASVTTDNRKIAEGGLFIALKGERFDAHDFADQAVERGAVALLLERHLDLDIPQLIVADTRIALGQLARYVRSKLAVECCAITGSNGKTTVKEMTAAILSQSYSVLATQGNFNNDIGVPLSLLRLEAQHQRAVLELGANHIGEIAYTVAMVQPKVCLVNNIGSAHIEGFGSREGVLQAKSEIFAPLGAEQIGIVEYQSQDEAYLRQVLAPAKALSFSLDHPQADYYAADIESNLLNGSKFLLHTPNGEQAIQLKLLGLHNVKNAVAAAALATQLGASLVDIAQGLASLTEVSGRLQQIPLHKYVHLINDSYNANPASFLAAIETLALADGPILIAGDMAEMGDETESAHELVVDAARQRGIRVYSYGPHFKQVMASLGLEKYSFHDHDSLFKALLSEFDEPAKPSTVLVKGSRGSSMERVVEALQQHYKKGIAC